MSIGSIGNVVYQTGRELNGGLVVHLPARELNWPFSQLCIRSDN